MHDRRACAITRNFLHDLRQSQGCDRSNRGGLHQETPRAPADEPKITAANPPRRSAASQRGPPPCCRRSTRPRARNGIVLNVIRRLHPLGHGRPAATSRSRRSAVFVCGDDPRPGAPTSGPADAPLPQPSATAWRRPLLIMRGRFLSAGILGALERRGHGRAAETATPEMASPVCRLGAEAAPTAQRRVP
jgi:hypothetical protein